MNIYDIAEMAGVSIATVSRVMSGSDKVSDKTRKKVLSVIEESGYTPNVFAQGLGVGTIHSIGILVPDITDLYMASAVSYIENELQKNGYNCLLGCSGFELPGKESHLHMLLDKRVDALFLVGSTFAGSGKTKEETDYIRAAAAQVPVIIINGAVEGENIYSAVCADRQAMYDVTTSLIQRGRKRILFLTDSRSYSAREKKAGYLSALQDAGIPIDEKLQLHVPNRIHTVRDILLSLEEPDFDAVVATDDGIAVGAVKYAAQKGLSIPEDLQVVGYNNSSLSFACEPELTSIDNRTEEVCRSAVHALLQLLSAKDEEADVKEKTPSSLVVPCQIVKRQTTDF
ncbi:MAG: LacI family DNA-binding transcriptional regulator [Lachnospiraceae bacterium]|nr:LacI family DNA-binding transcriptional regulator [Lachnospiraceae bacterium]